MAPLFALTCAWIARLPSRVGRLCAPAAWGALTLLAMSAPEPARAQALPNNLSDIRLEDVASGEARLTLDFTQAAPAYSIAGADRDHVEITLTNTTNRSALVGQTSTRLIREVKIRQDSSNVVLVIEAAVPVRVVASPSQRRLVLTVTTATASASAGSGPANTGPGGLPRAVDPPPGEDGFELIPLKYADVSEVVGLLTEGVTVKSNDSFNPREPGFGSPGASGANYNPVPAQQSADDKPLGQAVDGSLAIDRRLNAVWVKGSPAHIARVKAEIAAIDVPVDSVVLETEFVELTESGARNVGIDFANSSGQIAVGTFQSGQFVTSGVYGSATHGLASASLQAAIYAQIQAGQGRIVSRPRIAAQSGGAAKIITGDALPILTAITLSGVNGVSQQVQYVNVGVTLQIAPRISADGYVTSHVFCVVSSVTGYSQGYPTISQRNAETLATVKDGETFVIGGLTQEDTIKTRGSVPGLAGLPLVGRAFQLERDTRTKTELYIIITPHVVRRANAAAP